jgi:hypothetical protein
MDLPCSAVALLQDFVGFSSAGSNDWTPLADCCMPLSDVPEARLFHVVEDCGEPLANFSSSDHTAQPAPRNKTLKSGAHRVSSALSDDHAVTPLRGRTLATPSSLIPRALPFCSRISEPRLKNGVVSPGPGAYSPTAPAKTSVAVKFGHSINHQLPFRGSYCQENFVSHKAIPDQAKLIGTASAFSFPRLRRVAHLTASASHQTLAASCSPLIGPGTYDIQPGMASSQMGHVIPLGPRGSDLRSFRRNRVLKHSYETNENDSVIGLPALYHCRIMQSFSACK